MALKSFPDKVWSFLSSIKLAVVLFALIALTSIVGTVIQQQASHETNIKVLTHFVGAGLAPSAYRVLDALGFMNMYRSWWFLSLLILFAVNLLVCSIERFPGIWRLMRTPMKPIAPEAMMKMPVKRDFKLRESPSAIEKKALAGMRSIGFKAARHEEEGGAVVLYAQRHAWSRAGVYVTHASILIILIGALLGIFIGFQATLNLPEGNSTNIVFSRSADFSDQAKDTTRENLMSGLDAARGNFRMAASALGQSLSEYKKGLKQVGLIPLDFNVLCQRFDVRYYGSSDMPKSYNSLLTIIKEGQPVLTKLIRVNHPLTYEGVTFYQSSYGLLDDLSNGMAVLSITPPGGQTGTEEKLKIGQSFNVPGTKETVKLVKFSPAVAFDNSGNAFTYAHQMSNPGVQVEIDGGKTASTRWILQRYPQTWIMPDGSTIGLEDFWGVQYTGLEVRKDPGVWVVYLGCITLAIGLFMAFFLSHKKIWVRLDPEQKGKGTRLTIAGTSSKNREAFERGMEKLFLEFQKGGK